MPAVVGLRTKANLIVGDVLSFRLALPGAMREIFIQCRVLWGQQFARFGCEFVRIPPVDVMILHEWLKKKIRVKKPLVAV
jgi:hypothetical protein